MKPKTSVRNRPSTKAFWDMQFLAWQPLRLVRYERELDAKWKRCCGEGGAGHFLPVIARTLCLSLIISVSMCMCFSRAVFLFVSISLFFLPLFHCPVLFSVLPSLWPSPSSFFVPGYMIGAEPHSLPASPSPPSPVLAPALTEESLPLVPHRIVS